MKKAYRATIEFDIPVLGESPEDAVEYLKKNYFSIWNDYKDILREVHPSDLFKITLENLYDSDDLVYNSDNGDTELGDYVKEHATEEEKEKYKIHLEKLNKIFENSIKA